MCTDVTSGFSVTESACAVNGQVTTDIIYEDSKGEICYAQREIPFEYNRNLTADGSILTCSPNCVVSAFSYVLNGDNRLDVRIEININGFIFCEKEKLITTELAVNKERVKTIKTASLTIYFAESGEAVWDIAEKYNTTVEYKVGTMIEIPRAALFADEMAKEAEFFSFGTNDLTQMTFGFSRDDIGSFLPEYMENRILDSDPFQTIDVNGVGRLIEYAVTNGRSTRSDLKIGICGEQGGEGKSVMFCHKAGLNYVSCSPFRVPVARLAAAQAAIADIQQ